MTTGAALIMKTQLARLQAQYGIAPEPFTPIAPFAPVAHDVVIQGLASPATIDRESVRFAPDCWKPFASTIPFLLRHEQPAGRLEDLRVTEDGLFVRARVTHKEAKTCPYFSIAAIVHTFRIVQAGARSFAEITSATLDDVSVVFDPGNADALVCRPPPVVEVYDLAKTAFEKGIEIIEALRRLDARQKPNMFGIWHGQFVSMLTLCRSVECRDRRHRGRRNFPNSSVNLEKCNE